MELLPWIDVHKLRRSCLNENENALDYLYAHPHLISISFIVKNPSFPINYETIPMHYIDYSCIYSNSQPGIEDIIRHASYTRQDWYYICKNPACMNLIIENPKKYEYHWNALSKNSNAVPFLKENFEHIDWEELCHNHSYDAVYLLMQHTEYINWLTFSSNPFAIDILRKFPDKINFWGLSWNYNAIDILEKNLHRTDISWMGLSQNKNAIHILKQNQDKIDWMQLSLNPSIFAYPYQRYAMERTEILREELMMKTLHPKRIQYWLDNGLDIEDLPE